MPCSTSQLRYSSQILRKWWQHCRRYDYRSQSVCTKPMVYSDWNSNHPPKKSKNEEENSVRVPSHLLTTKRMIGKVNRKTGISNSGPSVIIGWRPTDQRMATCSKSKPRTVNRFWIRLHNFNICETGVWAKPTSRNTTSNWPFWKFAPSNILLPCWPESTRIRKQVNKQNDSYECPRAWTVRVDFANFIWH